jgi:Protein of unknown function (DUF4240)
MDDEEFWALIDLITGSRWDDSTSDVTGLVEALAALPAEEIAAFYGVLGDKALALATHEHYAAFSWFPGLADTFLYARLAVIANGRKTYEMILSKPSQFPARSTNIWFEKLLYVCDDAYRIATGQDFPRPGSAKFEVMIK